MSVREIRVKPEGSAGHADVLLNVSEEDEMVDGIKVFSDPTAYSFKIKKYQDSNMHPLQRQHEMLPPVKINR